MTIGYWKNYENRNAAQNDVVHSNFFLMPYRFCGCVQNEVYIKKMKNLKMALKMLQNVGFFAAYVLIEAILLEFRYFQFTYNIKEFKRIFDNFLFDTECRNHNGVFYFQLITGGD